MRIADVFKGRRIIFLMTMFFLLMLPVGAQGMGKYQSPNIEFCMPGHFKPSMSLEDGSFIGEMFATDILTKLYTKMLNRLKEYYDPGNVRWMVFLIIGLGLLLSITVALFFIDKDIYFTILSNARSFLLFALSVTEIFYVIYVDDIIWFCDEPRYLSIMSNSDLFTLLHGIIVVSQFIAYFVQLYVDSCEHYLYGLGTSSITFVLSVLTAKVFEAFFYLILMIAPIFQCVQMVIIFRRSKIVFGMPYACYGVCNYIVSTIAMFIILIPYYDMFAWSILMFILYYVFYRIQRLFKSEDDDE